MRVKYCQWQDIQPIWCRFFDARLTIWQFSSNIFLENLSFAIFSFRVFSRSNSIEVSSCFYVTSEMFPSIRCSTTFLDLEEFLDWFSGFRMFSPLISDGNGTKSRSSNDLSVWPQRVGLTSTFFVRVDSRLLNFSIKHGVVLYMKNSFSIFLRQLFLDKSLRFLS